MFGSVGSIRATKPSPPVTMNQSLFVGALGAARPRRTSQGAVVLRAAVDVVDRRGVVDLHVVELRHREVGEVPPQAAAIPALVQSAVACPRGGDRCCRDRSTRSGCRRAWRVRPPARKVRPPSSETCVRTAMARRRGSAILRIGMDVLVVHRLGLDIAAALPAVAGVERGIQGHAIGGLHLGVDQSLARGRERRDDAAEVSRRQAAADLAPRLAAVDSTCAGRSRARRESASRCAAAAGGPRRASRRDCAGRCATSLMPVCSLIFSTLLQVVAAVGGLVQAALASGRPQGAVGCDEDHLRVARIDDDAPDLLRSLQPEIPPRPAGIVTAVHAVAVPDAALVVGFARAHPDRARGCWRRW